jgi:hypothetical protein
MDVELSSSFLDKYFSNIDLYMIIKTGGLDV